jgi:hypothetical protein
MLVMQGDMPDGSFSEEYIRRLEAEGIIEIARPGTPEWEAALDEMAEQLDAEDAERLALDGPDALTSDRMLRQTALVLERDPESVAYALAAWCQSHGWTRSDLASWLGLTIDGYAALALELRAADDIVDRHAVDPERLAAVLAG